MRKSALITGISGQDGAYLAKLLIDKNYRVIGTDRRSARFSNWRLKRLGVEKKIIFEEMELNELYEIQRVFKKYRIDEVYHLAAQSFVKTSFNSPLYTSNITGLGALRILETIRSVNSKIKFYQASSSEMFGDVLDKIQNEKTPLNPQSPYAISKVFAHYITKNYRDSYNIFAVSGILFNHESPLRGEEFVTRKIVIGLIKILKNELKQLELGNLNAKRDWGYAKEYVEAMFKMLQQNKPDDYVISTGSKAVFKYCLDNKIKLIYSATSASLGNNGKDKDLSPYAFTKSKNLELLENLKKWFNFKFEVIYFYNVYGPNQISIGKMATVIGIFENLFEKNKPLTVVKPGSQSRKFTHIDDTIKVCYEAWKKNKCQHYSISHKKSYTVLEVAKMFKSKIIFVKPRLGERYASALTKFSNNNKIISRNGKIDLKDYISSFIKG